MERGPIRKGGSENGSRKINRDALGDYFETRVVQASRE